jgi:hypothetical protein
MVETELSAERTSLHRYGGRHFDLDHPQLHRSPGSSQERLVVVTDVTPLAGDSHSLDKADRAKVD